MPQNINPTILRPLALVIIFLLSIASSQAQQAPAITQALRYLATQRAPLGLTEQDIADPLVTDTYTDAHNGVSHVYLRQRYQGLEVQGAEMSVHLNRQGNLVHQSGAFVSRIATKIGTTMPAVTEVAATRSAARALGLAPVSLRAVTASRGSAATSSASSAARSATLRDEALSRRPIEVALVLSRDDNGNVQLVWDLELTPPRTAHRWNVQVDAATGQVLRQTDRIIHERTPKASAATSTPAGAAALAQRGAAADGASYRVFPFPIEGPGFGPRELRTNPADPLASPYGWHDTNGRDGAEFTITRGNNVYAYIGPEPRPVYSSNGGANLRFDFPYDIALPPLANQDAAITNLFYINNVVHDVAFQYGFDEASGNFQQTNYTSKGKARDAVLAVAEDPTDTNNAYFSPGVDGDTSSMHMFLWPQPARLRFEVTAPASIAGLYSVVEGQLGPSFSATPLTGRLVVVNDGSDAPSRACATNALLNAAEVRGNIAVIDRGDCNFSVKILAAQTAGAIAVVVVNNVEGAPIPMGGTPDDINIPALMTSLADGNRLKAALAAGSPVTVTIQRVAALAADRDGSFDNGIITHEYTHGISTRLTGGPSRNDCLPVDNGKKPDDPAYVPYETMGEGWSDFFALWFTTKPGDKGETPRSVGTYVLAQPATGTGIRVKPYSTDFKVNNHTYAFIGEDMYTETHDVGEVWAAVLWDLNWSMIARYGYDPDLYKGTGGNNKTMQLVMDGMKLQPCRPGFITGRDAILAADRANFNGANRAIIWRAFARRGMGTDAEQGTVSALDNKVGFKEPNDLEPLTTPGLEIYPNPVQDSDEYTTIRAFSSGVDPNAEVTLTLTTMIGQTVYSERTTAGLLQQGIYLRPGSLTNGIYIVRAQAGSTTLGTKKLVVNH